MEFVGPGAKACSLFWEMKFRLFGMLLLPASAGECASTRKWESFLTSQRNLLYFHHLVIPTDGCET